MEASDLKPRDRVRLSGTGSEGVVQAVRDNTVTVKLDGDGTITTSAYQVELVVGVRAQAGKVEKKAAKKSARKKD
jgi:preprotein translocase subunit YajC